MKMNKSSVAIMISSLLTMSSFAAEQVTANIQEPKSVNDFYGKLNISLQINDEEGESFNSLNSNSSRVGVKGKYYLENGLTAIYKLEWQVNVNDDSKDSLTARNQWVGFQGDFGEITVGRSDTTLKVSQGKFDLFNDYEGDLKHLFIGENRETDAITYKSPVYKNIQLLTSYIISDDADESDPYSIGILFGDLNLKKTDFYFSIAHDENMPAKYQGVDNLGEAISGTKPLANTRITGMYKFDALQVGAMFVDTEVVESGKSETGYVGNIAYDFGDIIAKLQYQDFAGAGSLSVGADYMLGKNTKVFAWYTDREGNELTTTDGSTYQLASEGQYFAIGMEQKF
ncbi:porin [Colwellia sp. E2M01]|uniref:porin n=1 Tax=Colwellia sp. E2M01 TaxID=2841561 RepID=UPI001C08CE06|nr:porin [Colwellia sp. E2M01]MBU2869387.1 porin [Colwellia sp. E2M01]